MEGRRETIVFIKECLTFVEQKSKQNMVKYLKHLDFVMWGMRL